MKKILGKINFWGIIFLVILVGMGIFFESVYPKDVKAAATPWSWPTQSFTISTNGHDPFDINYFETTTKDVTASSPGVSGDMTRTSDGTIWLVIKGSDGVNSTNIQLFKSYYVNDNDNSGSVEFYDDWQGYGGPNSPYLFKSQANSYAEDPVIVSDRYDNIYVFWWLNTGSEAKLYFDVAKSIAPEGGASQNRHYWAPEPFILSDFGQVKYPKVAFDGDNKLNIIWQDPTTWDIKYRSKASVGEGKDPDPALTPADFNKAEDWSEIETILTNDGSKENRMPSMAIGLNNIIHLVWAGKGWGGNLANYNIRYMNNDSDGDNLPDDFPSTTGVNPSGVYPVTDINYDQLNPDIAISPVTNSSNGAGTNDAHVTWQGQGTLGDAAHPEWDEGERTSYNIRYIKRYATGTWEAMHSVTAIAYNTNYPYTSRRRNHINPKITADLRGMVFIVWEYEWMAFVGAYEYGVHYCSNIRSNERKSQTTGATNDGWMAVSESSGLASGFANTPGKNPSGGMTEDNPCPTAEAYLTDGNVAPIVLKSPVWPQISGIRVNVQSDADGTYDGYFSSVIKLKKEPADSDYSGKYHEYVLRYLERGQYFPPVAYSPPPPPHGGGSSPLSQNYRVVVSWTDYGQTHNITFFYKLYDLIGTDTGWVP